MTTITKPRRRTKASSADQLDLLDLPDKKVYASYGSYMGTFSKEEFEDVMNLIGVKADSKTHQGMALVLRESYKLKYAAERAGVSSGLLSLKLRKLREKLELAKRVTHLKLPRHWS